MAESNYGAAERLLAEAQESERQTGIAAMSTLAEAQVRATLAVADLLQQSRPSVNGSRGRPS